MIKLMQESYEETMQKAIGRVIKKERKRRNLKFTIFCYENDISKTTLYMIERGKIKAYITTVFKIVFALGLTLSEFSALVEKELPEGFQKPEI